MDKNDRNPLRESIDSKLGKIREEKNEAEKDRGEKYKIVGALFAILMILAMLAKYLV
ncbi:MAG: hypothetical protein HXK87_03210 [Lachnospiraceae bacterium]|jgi:hypothetical protein|nr:hypothetical protein [Lachnospiraceae bacterium]